jgi:chemotaxis protein histidine kinase CheA
MELLTLSTKTGSPKLVAMEKNANKMISLSNKDITGKMLRASSNAVEGVLKQREIEEEQFKERETKANEADQKRYSKSRYRKWKNQKDASEDANADQEVSEAKERTQEDNTKEIKYKTESNQGQEATKDLEKKIEKENAKFERQEKVAGGHKLPVTKPAWLP